MENELTDEQLVKEIRENNPELYSQIIERYKEKLFNYLRKFIRSFDEIEDVLQAVFIKVFKNLYSFDIERKFSSWIYRIARNEALNYIKKHYKGGVSINDIEYKIIDEKMNVHEQAGKVFLKEDVERWIDEIKIKYREPIILFYFEGKSYEEISDILRIPKNSVGSLISRGRDALRLIIEKQNAKYGQ